MPIVFYGLNQEEIATFCMIELEKGNASSGLSGIGIFDIPNVLQNKLQNIFGHLWCQWPEVNSLSLIAAVIIKSLGISSC